MNIKNLKDVNAVLQTYMPKLGEVNWFFAREDMKDLLNELGNPQEKYPIIHIAGTSGKTSTSYYIAKMLQLTGQKVGLTVSPHVTEVNERLQIDGVPMNEDQYCKLFAEFMSILPRTNRKPTYFGLLVSFAYWAFAKLGVDYAVVEVGMGGRLDATNIIVNPTKIAVITDIGLDHTRFLGNTLDKIAAEKAGIIQPHSVVFMIKQNPEVMDVVTGIAARQHAQLHVLGPDFTGAPKILPPFGRRNWSLARAVTEYVILRDNLNAPGDRAWAASADLIIPARMELFKTGGDRTIIVDGSHNAQKISALVDGLQQKFAGKTIAVLVSFIEGKDSTLGQSLAHLRKVSDSLIATSFATTQDIHRAAIDPQEIANYAEKAGFTETIVCKDPHEAFKRLLASSAQVLVVTGSFFLAHQIRPMVQGEAS